MCILEVVRRWFAYDPCTGVVSWTKKPNRNIRVGAAAGFRWTDGANTYIRITAEGRQVFAHTVAFILMTGDAPLGVIDHQNGDGTDNSWANLRDVTHTENLRNQRRNARNTSGTMGVDFHKASHRWRARIIVNQQERHLGLFRTKELAVIARKSAEESFGFHPNHGRTA
jgi:hypothetical protein